MKKLIPFLTIALCLPVAVIVTSNAPIETQAAASGYKAASLPKTIDLNPVPESEVRSYYNSLNGKNLQGDDLLKALKPILKNNQQYYSYDSGNAIWQMYEITDRDWTLSPAENITNGTYDKATNTITNYKYGSLSDPLDNPYLHLLYRNHDEPASNIRAWDHHGDNKGIDREHIWPKSRGFGVKDGNEVKVPGARGDIHHLLPGDSYVNSSSHSNNSYGFVDPTKITDNAGNKYKIDNKVVVGGNYRGTSQTFGTTLGTNEVFEPQDCDKGDIARACFYMVARYNNLAGDDDTIDAGNPNLFLEDTVDTATIYSTATKPVSIGILRDLLAWHKLDPVDDYEIHRNDLIYRNYGKNRNPFIDFPNWVDAVWGTVELGEDQRTIKARNSNPSGLANPSTDTLYSASSPVVSIEAKPTATTYFVQENFAFEGNVIATCEDNSKRDVTKDCSFSNYDLSKVGGTTVTVTYSNSSITTNYAINVAQPESLELSATTFQAKQNEKFVFNGKVFGKLNDIKRDITAQCAIPEVDTSKPGKVELTIVHNPSGLTIKATVEVQENLAPFGLSWPIFIAIAAGAVVLLLVIFIIVMAKSKKARKAVAKAAKKSVKKSVKKNSKR